MIELSVWQLASVSCTTVSRLTDQTPFSTLHFNGAMYRWGEVLNKNIITAKYYFHTGEDTINNSNMKGMLSNTPMIQIKWTKTKLNRPFYQAQVCNIKRAHNFIQGWEAFVAAFTVGEGLMVFMVILNAGGNWANNNELLLDPHPGFIVRKTGENEITFSLSLFSPSLDLSHNV